MVILVVGSKRHWHEKWTSPTLVRCSLLPPLDNPECSGSNGPENGANLPEEAKDFVKRVQSSKST